jgi:hypothetical protein
MNERQLRHANRQLTQGDEDFAQRQYVEAIEDYQQAWA